MNDTSQTIRRSWWQIALHPWTAVIVTGSIALLATALECWQLQREATVCDALDKYDAYMTIEGGWLRAMWPEHWKSNHSLIGDRVARVNFRKSAKATLFQDQNLRMLDQFHNLREAHLENTSATLPGLHARPCFPQLEVIGLGPGSVDNDSLELLNEVPNLRELTFLETGLPDSALATLRDLPKLKTLYVSRGTFSRDAEQWFHGYRPDVDVTEPVAGWCIGVGIP